ncbi:hypothetical protein Q7P35_001463 [Cladosporium inversicolor]
MKLSLIFLGALVSFGVASPTLHRRTDCTSSAECEEHLYCKIDEDGNGLQVLKEMNVNLLRIASILCPATTDTVTMAFEHRLLEGHG